MLFWIHPKSFQRPLVGSLTTTPRAASLPPSSHSEGSGQKGLCLLFQGSTPFSSVTVDFTHGGWRQLAPAPRDRFEEGMPEKSRNLVLLGKETIQNSGSVQFWKSVVLRSLEWAWVALMHQRDSVYSSSFTNERSLHSGLGKRQFHFVPPRGHTSTFSYFPGGVLHSQ